MQRPWGRREQNKGKKRSRMPGVRITGRVRYRSAQRLHNKDPGGHSEVFILIARSMGNHRKDLGKAMTRFYMNLMVFFPARAFSYLYNTLEIIITVSFMPLCISLHAQPCMKQVLHKYVLINLSTACDAVDFFLSLEVFVLWLWSGCMLIPLSILNHSALPPPPFQAFLIVSSSFSFFFVHTLPLGHLIASTNIDLFLLGRTQVP